jgi:hypothetical protein
MFGKKSKQTSLEKFVTQKGVEAGNLKRAIGKPLKATEGKSSPLAVHPVKTRKMSPGKAGPVRIVGD